MMILGRYVALSRARQTRHICGGISGRAITPQGTRALVVARYWLVLLTGLMHYLHRGERWRNMPICC